MIKKNNRIKELSKKLAISETLSNAIIKILLDLENKPLANQKKQLI